MNWELLKSIGLLKLLVSIGLSGLAALAWVLGVKTIATRRIQIGVPWWPGQRPHHFQELAGLRAIRAGIGYIVIGVGFMVWVYLGLFVLGSRDRFQSSWEWSLFVLGSILIAIGAFLRG